MQQGLETRYTGIYNAGTGQVVLLAEDLLVSCSLQPPFCFGIFLSGKLSTG